MKKREKRRLAVKKIIQKRLAVIKKVDPKRYEKIKQEPGRLEDKGGK